MTGRPPLPPNFCCHDNFDPTSTATSSSPASSFSTTTSSSKRNTKKSNSLPSLSRRWKAFRKNQIRKQLAALEEEREQNELSAKYQNAVHDAVARVLERTQNQPQEEGQDKRRNETVSKTSYQEDADERTTTILVEPLIEVDSDQHGGLEYELILTNVEIGSHLLDDDDDEEDAFTNNQGSHNTAWKKQHCVEGVEDDMTEATSSTITASSIGSSTSSSFLFDDDQWSVTSSIQSLETLPLNNTCKYLFEKQYRKNGWSYVDAFTAAKHGDLQSLRRLANTGNGNYDWSKVDSIGNPPLFYACAQGAHYDLKCVVFLLEQWIHQHDRLPPTSLLTKCHQNAISTWVQVLLEYPHQAQRIISDWEDTMSRNSYSSTESSHDRDDLSSKHHHHRCNANNNSDWDYEHDVLAGLDIVIEEESL